MRSADGKAEGLIAPIATFQNTVCWREATVLKNLTMAQRPANFRLCVRTQKITVVPVVEAEAFGRTSRERHCNLSGPDSTTPPLHTSPAPSSATSHLIFFMTVDEE
ncbi:hypothetical protein BJ165DRAFT_1530727 [Panaeolus papilionaceus]|nr:hypothetical protein BJ165DRAFT_1530727 [Panaeolus papilionaceus]